MKQLHFISVLLALTWPALGEDTLSSFQQVLVKDEAMLQTSMSTETYQSNYTNNVENAVVQFSESVLEESFNDMLLTGQLQNSLIADGVSLTALSLQVTENITSLQRQAQLYTDEMKPSNQLIAASSQENSQRAQVHKIYRQCRLTTADVDKQLNELQTRAQEIRFIVNSLAGGADTAKVGRLVRRYGDISNIHNVIERSLVHLLAVQNDVKRSQSDVIALLELEETPPSWTESVQNILDSIKLGVEGSYAKVSFVADSVSSFVHSLNVPSPISNLIPRWAPSADHTPEVAPVDVPSTAVNIQLATLLTSPAGESIDVVLRNITVEQLRLLCFQSVARATGDSAASLQSLADVFNRNLTHQELALAVFGAILEQVVPGSRVFDLSAKSRDSVKLTVHLSEYTQLRALSVAIASGNLRRHIDDRLKLPPTVSVTLDDEEQTMPTLLSLDESVSDTPTQIDCTNGQCPLGQIGTILARVLKSAEETRATLQINKEKLMQPCSTRLSEAQQSLALAEAAVTALKLTQPNNTAQLEMTSQSVDTLNTLQQSVLQFQKSIEEQSKHVLEYEIVRQQNRDSALSLMMFAFEYIGLPPQPQIEKKKQLIAQKQRGLGDGFAQMQFLLSQLETKRTYCKDNLEDKESNIRKLKNSLDLLGKMIVVVSSYGYGDESKTAVQVMALALHSSVDSSKLLQLKAGDPTVGSVVDLIQSLRTTTATSLAELQQSYHQLQEQCTHDIGVLNQELLVLTQQSKTH